MRPVGRPGVGRSAAGRAGCSGGTPACHDDELPERRARRGRSTTGARIFCQVRDREIEPAPLLDDRASAAASVPSLAASLHHGRHAAIASQQRCRDGPARCAHTPARCGRSCRAGTARRSATSAMTRPGRAAITTMRLREVDRLEDRVGDEDHGEASGCAHSASRSSFSFWRVISSSAANGSSISRSFGSRDQRAGDRHAHLHAARQFARIGLREAARARPAPAPRRPRSAPRRAGTRCKVERQLDVGLTPSPTASASAPGRRSRRRASAGRANRGRSPASRCVRRWARRGRRSCAAACDLPQPEGPSRLTNSPARRSRSTPAAPRACRWRSAWRRRGPAAPAGPRDASIAGSTAAFQRRGDHALPTPLLTNSSDVGLLRIDALGQHADIGHRVVEALPSGHRSWRRCRASARRPTATMPLSFMTLIA